MKKSFNVEYQQALTDVRKSIDAYMRRLDGKQAGREKDNRMNNTTNEGAVSRTAGLRYKQERLNEHNFDLLVKNTRDMLYRRPALHSFESMGRAAGIDPQWIASFSCGSMEPDYSDEIKIRTLHNHLRAAYKAWLPFVKEFSEDGFI